MREEKRIKIPRAGWGARIKSIDRRRDGKDLAQGGGWKGAVDLLQKSGIEQGRKPLQLWGSIVVPPYLSFFKSGRRKKSKPGAIWS